MSGIASIASYMVHQGISHSEEHFVSPDLGGGPAAAFLGDQKACPIARKCT